MELPQEELSLTPLLTDIRDYRFKKLFADLFAGLSVSFLSIPQALAYAMVAGLPAFCGLVSIIFGTAIAALLGSSKHLVLGPNNATVLLVEAAVAGIVTSYYPSMDEKATIGLILPIMAALVFFISLFQLAFAVLKLGKAIQFVSQAVLLGYILGSSFALTLEQLYPFLGIKHNISAGSLYEKLSYLLMHIKDFHLPTTFVSVMSFTIFITLSKLKFKVPAPLTMILLVTGLVYGLDLQNITDVSGRVLRTIGDAGPIDGIMPDLQLPFFDITLLNMLLPIAFAIALFSMLETTSLAKNISANSGQRLQTNQEIFGLGASNLVLSFFGALPCSSSMSRTYMNYDSGAKTRFAAFFSAIFVFLFVYFFGPFIRYVPTAALAALILATAMRMVDVKQIKICFKATHSDAFVLVITFVSCIFFSLHIAFYIGVALSIGLYLRKAASPEVVEYVYDDESEELRPLTISERKLKRKVRIINVEGELFFGAVDLFQTALKAIAEDDDETKVFILRLKHVRDIDATACLALKQLFDYLRKSSRYLVVSSIPDALWNVLEKADLINYIGKDNLLHIDEVDARQAIERALERASVLMKGASFS